MVSLPRSVGTAGAWTLDGETEARPRRAIGATPALVKLVPGETRISVWSDTLYGSPHVEIGVETTVHGVRSGAGSRVSRRGRGTCGRKRKRDQARGKHENTRGGGGDRGRSRAFCAPSGMCMTPLQSTVAPPRVPCGRKIPPIRAVSPCDFDVLRILIYFVLGKRSSAPPSSTPISPDHARPRDCRADDSREDPRHDRAHTQRPTRECTAQRGSRTHTRMTYEGRWNSQKDRPWRSSDRR